MSKIGRRPIDISGVEVTVSGRDVSFKGKSNSGTFTLSQGLEATLTDNELVLKPVSDSAKRGQNKDVNMVWGMNRALLANEIAGAKSPFELILQIKGLGYKAAQVGDKLELTLGYSHKITTDIPEGISVEMDKTGQNITVKSSNKELLGAFCDRIKSLRPPEPYKGTGIKLSTETIARKAGKAKGG